MFYQFEDEITTIELDKINSHYISAGYITLNEFESIYDTFGFSRYAVDFCKNNSDFGSSVEINDDYSFAVFNIKNAENMNESNDSFVVFVKKNLFIVVDISSDNCSIRDSFLNSLGRYSCINITIEKLLVAFLDDLINKNKKAIKESEFEITRLEEVVLKNKATDQFNFMLLNLKKELLVLRNSYEQLIDVVDSFKDNDNEVFEDDDLKHLSNFKDKVKRLREDIDMLRSSVSHLQDAYSASLELKTNHIMGIFTAVTTIFFPLTLIVGWYGMNFKNMPELSWKFGYLFVIVFSILVVSVLTIIMKKRKWL